MLDVFFYITMVLFLTVCLFMILLVLIQKGRGGGLASAFGGAGGNTAFRSKTGDVLTGATSVLFGTFLVLSIALNLRAISAHRRRCRGLCGPDSIHTSPSTPTTTDPLAPTTLPTTNPTTQP